MSSQIKIFSSATAVELLALYVAKLKQEAYVQQGLPVSIKQAMSEVTWMYRNGAHSLMQRAREVASKVVRQALRLDDKRKQRVGFEPGTSGPPD